MQAQVQYPKLLMLSLFTFALIIIILAHLENHFIIQTLFIIVCRLVCFALWIAFQVWESILDHLFSRWLTVVVYVLKYNREDYKAKPMAK